MPMILSFRVDANENVASRKFERRDNQCGLQLDRGDKVGSLEAGKRANFSIFNCNDYREIAYYFGVSLSDSVYVGGKRVFDCSGGL